MIEKRLMDIALLSLENDLSDTICFDDVLTEFEGNNKRVVLV